MQADALWAPKIFTLRGFVKENMLRGAAALDVGCGGRKLPGSTGMDILRLPGVDVVHSFNRTPWPFADGAFDLVFLNHALEHVGDVVAVMNEVHRVLKPEGRAVIQVPYFRCIDAYNDPTHTHFFTARTLDYFIKDAGLSRYAYSGDKLFDKKGFWYGWPHRSRNPLRQALKNFMHRYPAFYDQYLSLIIPTECLTWELEALKR
ncbi:MAG: Methyltransferase domain protein [Parcubacteria group bacterium GW2011_GWA1_47_11]|nr:MAG: Methyltransferase domain protein [Parcubacteria group bacterium GW2011_GWA1_47_11]